MYTRSVHLYDAIYAYKDYAVEAEKLHALIQQHKRSPGNALLDVACGTGGHIPFLRQHYVIEGLDINAEMLAIARQKHPDIRFHQGSMVDFDLGRQFDVIVCLFSSIGYVQTVDLLQQTLQTLSRHALPGGLVIVEPWITPEQWEVGRVVGNFVNEPALKAARMSISQREGNVAIMDTHYLVGTPAGIEYLTERHEMGLFTHEEYLTAFQDAGLDVTYDTEGLIGRGLYIGLQVAGG